ncbi:MULTISPECIES: DMT family transporter [unclassified Polaromonas]|jgi:drug/metabolite transporter (DMT)-like permease|uniref:DMT family transporter n=1 Tax=unclassified Polaromonas TaxID=2638319 RepID=UPI000BD09076|nr:MULTISPECIES: DMT family transporter [unclassified Polaromonas]OYY37433.1 MAG: transporter [Polaromonas sp. 35-63-35]OYZ21545.1 MAG: transporter [Polaromonas sp. 16-63-31]OYZ77686.1 MAG: transporter [Polaromonas sp. 24-63-21]OZA49985.1 MAG: transporter [Polaromonas sp. 17-63-33]OZA87023.1 MAG: transporter [Polaromonas sp. 39-63-25]
MNRNLAIGLLAALAAALIGSGWQIASRHGVTTTLGPLELAVLRYGIPALVLLPLLLRTGLFPQGLPRGQLVLLVLGGGLPFGLLVLAGAQWAPAAHMGVFMAGSVPLFTALGVRLVHGERFSGQRVAGLVLIVAAMMVFAASTLTGVSSAAGSWRGDLLFILAALLWAVYTLVFRGSGLTPWQGAAVINTWSLLLLLPVLLVVGAPRLLTAPWIDVAWQALGQGLVAGLLGLVTYMIAIARLGAAHASLSAALVPISTALGAAWLLGEPLGAGTLAASVLVACGVALASGALGRRV